jgi:hypothetical protein
MDWGVQIRGNPIDLEFWGDEFSSPSDPFVQVLPDIAGGEATYVLRWSGFDSAATSKEVIQLAIVLFDK